MKKLLAILVALTLALAGISAVAEEEKVTLSFLRIGNDEAERAFWQWAIEAFEKENADVRIAYEEAPIGESMDTVLNTRFASGEGVDLIGHGILSVAQRVEANQYMAIDEYFDSWEGKDDIMPSVLANGTYNGHVYGLGYSVTPYVFAYRSDLLEEAGIAVPTTWDELADAARELTKKNESGEVECAGFCYPQTGGNLVELQQILVAAGTQQEGGLASPLLQLFAQIEHRCRTHATTYQQQLVRSFFRHCEAISQRKHYIDYIAGFCFAQALCSVSYELNQEPHLVTLPVYVIDGNGTA